jgi:hypothetical protein
LFKELGLENCKTLEDCEKIIESLRLRQLDSLKSILARLANNDCFTNEVAEGIRKNDLLAFSHAVLQLNVDALENTN